MNTQFKELFDFTTLNNILDSSLKNNLETFNSSIPTETNSEIETFEIPRSPNQQITEAFKDLPINNLINLINQKISLLPEIEDYQIMLDFLSLFSKTFYDPLNETSITLSTRDQILENVSESFNSAATHVCLDTMDQTDEIPILFNENDSPVFPKTELKILRRILKSQELNHSLKENIGIIHNHNSFTCDQQS
jgi:hypothetical protein